MACPPTTTTHSAGSSTPRDNQVTGQRRQARRHRLVAHQLPPACCAVRACAAAGFARARRARCVRGAVAGAHPSHARVEAALHQAGCRGGHPPAWMRARRAPTPVRSRFTPCLRPKAHSGLGRFSTVGAQRPRQEAQCQSGKRQDADQARAQRRRRRAALGSAGCTRGMLRMPGRAASAGACGASCGVAPLHRCASACGLSRSRWGMRGAKGGRRPPETPPRRPAQPALPSCRVGPGGAPRCRLAHKERRWRAPAQAEGVGALRVSPAGAGGAGGRRRLRLRGAGGATGRRLREIVAAA